MVASPDILFSIVTWLAVSMTPIPTGYQEIDLSI